MAQQNTNPASTEPFGCATEDLLVVHRLFRNMFGRAPGLVRSARGANEKRLVIIDRHVGEIVQALHTHHHGEDVMLWERLEDRAPACALHVARMRTQHADIAERLEDISIKLTVWQVDRVTGLEPLAAALENVRDALEAHLADEEDTIRPLAGEFIRQSEWEGLREHGFDAIPPERRLVQLGLMLSAFDNDDERREFWVALPAPVRALYRIFGARQFRKEWFELYQESVPS